MGLDVPRARLSIRSRNPAGKTCRGSQMPRSRRPRDHGRPPRENGPNPRSRTWNRGSRRHRGPPVHGSEGEFYIGLQPPTPQKFREKIKTRGGAAQVFEVREPHSGRQIQATDARREGGSWWAQKTPTMPLDCAGQAASGLRRHTSRRSHGTLDLITSGE